MVNCTEVNFDSLWCTQCVKVWGLQCIQCVKVGGLWCIQCVNVWDLLCTQCVNVWDLPLESTQRDLVQIVVYLYVHIAGLILWHLRCTLIGCHHSHNHNTTTTATATNTTNL